MSEIRYVDSSEVKAIPIENGSGLRLTLPDQCILSARIKRVFPLSDPNNYLSLQDGAGKELAVLRSTKGLDSATHDLIRSELDRRYFTPVIERIDALRQEAGMWRFEVLTSRGPVEFYVRNWRESAFEVSTDRWFINGVDGGRFEIPSLLKLDEKSRRLMDQLL